MDLGLCVDSSIRSFPLSTPDQVYTVLGAFYVPLFITVACYTAIFVLLWLAIQ